jgi:hypothetical protein
MSVRLPDARSKLHGGSSAMNEHDLAEHGTELAAGCPKIAAGKVMDL